MTRDARIQLSIVLGVLVIALAGPSVADYYTDWLWFGETGYQQVFLTSLVTRVELGAGTAAFAFLLLFVNLRLALRQFAEPYLVLGVSPADGHPLVLQRRGVSLLIGGASAFISVLAGVFASSQWLSLLQFRHATSFGQRDPILGSDVAYYVFTLPFLTFARGLLLALLLFTLVGTALVYLLPGRSVAARSGPFWARGARRHLSLLAAVAFVLLAAGAYLDVAHLMVDPSGIIAGATYADVTARVPALWLLTGVSLVGALLAVVHAFTARSWPIVWALAGYLSIWLGGEIFASGVQRLVVTPNEQVKETPYIEYNIASTRKAFAIDRVEERQLSGDATLTRQDIDNNSGTISNVRLWDRKPLLDTFGQIQEIRTYYDFSSIDIDRYVIDGQYRQVMLSARELNSESLPNRTWINERLTFTHGYGLTLGPVNEVTPEGLPVLFIKNIPPESSVDLDVVQPSLYFSELASDYAFVNTRAKEFHYPRGDDNVYRKYEGAGGVNVGSFGRKLLFASRFRSFKILLSEDLTPDSRVLFHRNIMDRVTTIAPFLSFDRDPYLVIAGGRLFWMLDAYTATDQYPYSTPTDAGINYIRNSVKVVIDAYNGTTTFYLADRADPIAATLSKIFPGLLHPLGDMPAELRRHVRYPEGIFGIQSAMFATYHMTNPAVFYNKEDQWEVPAIESGSSAAPMEPYYTIMRLPRERDMEFIQMLPFTPRRKDNLAAWMVARSDGSHYGKLLVFQFPKQTVVFGPRQIVARINQDQLISPQITLWNQQGSEVIQGTLLVIPIEESLLYVRPLYLKAAGGKIPELKRVVVAYQNTIVMAGTLEAALDQVFPKGPATGSVAEPPPADTDVLLAIESTDSLAQQARDHFDRAMQAQRDGDWAGYGEEIRQVGLILEQLARKPASPDKAAKPAKK